MQEEGCEGVPLFGGDGWFRTVAPPLQMSGHTLDGIAPAPALSADTEAVLREIGVSEEDIALLLAAAGR